ncbi:MAG: hypothetical protein AB8G18_18910 [Gammaproteobacteria bacterium]
MTQLFNLFLITHVAAGAASLIFFWIPVAVKKGSKLHIRSGHWYARCMYLVAYSSLILSAFIMNDPIGLKHAGDNLTASQAFEIATERRGVALFLFAIGVLVVSNLRHGLLTLDEKASRERTRSASHTSLNIGLGLLALILAYTGYQQSSVLFYVFAALCSFTAFSNLRYAWRKTVDRGARIQSHLASMIGAGIASHTAFFVFGASRFLGEALSGNWQLVPWVAPGVIGALIINRLSRRYVRKPTVRKTSNA